MPPETERGGIIASDGLYAGPLLYLDQARAAHVPSGEPRLEHAALREAIAHAIVGLSALIEKTDETGAEILGFQLAMLEDDALSAPAHAAIDEGQAADAAWTRALDAEIAGYESSADEYFRARSADLRDIRDRVRDALTGATAAAIGGPAVLFGRDIAPTRFLETDWSCGGAILLTGGSTTSHVAMLARARGVPMLVMIGDGLSHAESAIVDAETGRAIFDPSPARLAAYEARQQRLAASREGDAAFLAMPAARRDGSRLEVMINVARPEDIDAIDAAHCDGVGLMRSEFLFADGQPLPGEDQQYRAYTRILKWAGAKPVTIRTLDIGGDKPIAGLTPAGEHNPFLGLRGVRLTLARPDVFRIQLRALARAAVHGNLKVMLPMVTVPEEVSQSAALLDACVAELTHAGIACARPPLGIMVEVPAVAVCPEAFGEAAFFSIGSNDLTQYVTATARDEASVASLNDPTNPAVLRLIANVVAAAGRHGIAVSLCGDMASEPAHLRALLDAGLRSFSVATARLGRIKRALSEL